MIKLGEISLTELRREFLSVDDELKKLKDLQEKKALLQKIITLVEEFYSCKGKLNSKIGTEQSRQFFRIMIHYPYLCLYKGYAGLSQFCAAYKDEKTSDFYAKNLEESLRISGFISRMENFLSNFKIVEGNELEIKEQIVEAGAV